MIRTFLSFFSFTSTSSPFIKQFADEEQSSHLSLTLEYVIANFLWSEMGL